IEANAFWDSNNNGQKGVYERAIAGTLVEIFYETGDIAASGTTDEEGKVLFGDVLPGTYRAAFTLPQGYWLAAKGTEEQKNPSLVEQQDSVHGLSDLFTVTQGQVTRIFVGGEKIGLLTGRLWEDINGNGIMEENEPGMTGAFIDFTNRKTGETYQVLPDEEGYFSFEARAGVFDGNFTGPDGYVFANRSLTGGKNRSLLTDAGVATGTVDVVISTEKKTEEKNIGWMKASSITGRAYIDENYNGVQDENELPLTQIEITLYQKGVEIASTLTDEEGFFTFNHLRGDTYRLRGKINEEMSFSKSGPDKEKYGNVFLEEANKNVAEAIVVLENGKDEAVGLGALYTGTIQGTAFVDVNFNGAYDLDEETLSAVKVSLYTQNGEWIGETRSDRDGNYAFSQVYPQNYYFSVEIPKEYTITKTEEVAAKNHLTHKDLEEGFTNGFSLSMGERKTDMHFGFIVSGEISGKAYVDENDNNAWEETEQGYVGMEVSLYDEKQAIAGQVYTDERGMFVFTDVLPGNYTIEYSLANTQVISKELAHSAFIQNEVRGKVVAKNITIAMAEKYSLPDIGIVDLGSISGTIFYDKDGNGLKEEGEEGYRDVSISYWKKEDPNDKIVVKPDQEGMFTLTELRPDVYVIAVTLQEGNVFSREQKNSLIVQSGEESGNREILLTNGEQMSGFVVGVSTPGALSGLVWQDQNNNGAFDAEDFPLANQNIVIIDESNQQVVKRIQTNDFGEYEVLKLLPGQYTVSLELSSDYGPATWIDGLNEFTTQRNGLYARTQVEITEGLLTKEISAAVIEYTSIRGMAWTESKGEKAPL
ncbi:MAG: hypothetical protein GX786_02255, partial [Clostridiales bacterium]|nr:hypothetical protein [Clostridiales bacterium]